MESQYLIPMVVLLVRVLLGVLFLMQGYDKIFRLGINTTAEAASNPVTYRLFGKGIYKAGIAVSSWMELVAGALLIIGFQHDAALMLLAIDMLGAGIVFSMIKPMWDMQFYFPRLAMLVFLAIIPPGWDIWSLDWMIK
jgi:uncharacterized membrane protein YphA (DoxX/SURF4 family)